MSDDSATSDMDLLVNGPAGRWKHDYVAALQESFTDETRPSLTIAVYGLVLFLFLTILGIPLGIQSIKRWNARSRKRRDRIRQVKDFLDRAVPVVAYPLMVNSELLRPGDKPRPGLFIISFDYQTFHPELLRLVGAIGLMDGSHWTDADRAWSIELMRDTVFKIHRRRLIPPSVVGNVSGLVAFACDLAIFPALLQSRHFVPRRPFVVPCMAEPGSTGRLVQLPHWIISGQRPSTADRAALIESTLTVTDAATDMAPAA